MKIEESRLLLARLDRLKKPDFRFKKITGEDYPFLREMLYQALFVPEGEKPYPRKIVNLPEISRYVRGWGRPGDSGLIIQKEGKSLGAVWCRLFTEDDKGYGFMDKSIPELTMAVRKRYRGKEWGTKLMYQNGVKALSLSVDKRNRALEFYRKFDFVVVQESGTSCTMMKEL
jgi:ribosomal protein S18 acetylase RimI-like enzyme